jgi:hypothetical protein
LATITRRLLVHLGQPKAWSTSLQDCFESSKHINYLGFRPSFAGRLWYTGNVGDGIEFGIRFESSKSFDRNFPRYRESLDAALTTDQLNVLSCEALSFRCFPGENDTREKLARLQRLIQGNEIELFYIWRQPNVLLKSLYREFIKSGYALDFEAFLEETYRLRTANFCDDLCGRTVMSDVSSIFAGCSINSYALTEDRATDANAIATLTSQLLGCDMPSIAHKNKSLSDELLAILLDLNKTDPRLLSFQDYLEHHRALPSLAYDDNSWVWRNARRRQAAVAKARDVLASRDSKRKLSMSGSKVDELLNNLSENCSAP